MSNLKEIDYLTEDTPIQGQHFACLSIVGPNMPQKCKVWGAKIRGCYPDLESAKQKAKRLQKSDPQYHVFVVEVGKFFPIAIDPNEIGNVEYSNPMLNELVKNYLENQEEAADHFETRKNEMVQAAIRENKEKAKLQNTKEHPIAVLKRIKDFEDKKQEIAKELESIEADISLAKEKFDTYTVEEKEKADEELRQVIESHVPRIENVENENIDTIRNNIMENLTLNETEDEKSEIDHTLSKLKTLENEISELKSALSLLDKEFSPNVFSNLESQISQKTEEFSTLKDTLNNKDAINNYLFNQNNSSYEFLNSDIIRVKEI
jgi:chromosome segregation ATPase